MKVVKWNSSDIQKNLTAQELFTCKRLNEMILSIYEKKPDDALEKYRLLNLSSENTTPVGPIDVCNPKYPTAPSSESFVLKNKNGIRIRFLSRGKDTTANFMLDGHVFVAHIDQNEYKKAKSIYQEGRNKIIDNMNVISLKSLAINS